jgi:hypothetical protein
MDRKQEDMQFLGLFSIFQVAYTIILSRRKKFLTQIGLTLILPLSFTNLAHTVVSKLLFLNINHNQFDQISSDDEAIPKYNHLSNFSITWSFWLFEAAYLTFSHIFSLLSIAAVVYTIACIYTGREVTFNQVMRVVPKIWKRLMLTCLSTFAAFFVYNIVAIILTLIFIRVLYFVSTDYVVPVLIVLRILYAAGFVYMVIVLQLANVVTVLEDAHGFHALSKSKALIKGKMGVSTVLFLMFSISVWLVQVAFQKLVVDSGDQSLGLANRVAIICLLMLFNLNLFWLVIQTVIYLVCKSYHHENIDKSALSDHLEAYLGEYVPSKTMDVRFEEFNV